LGGLAELSGVAWDKRPGGGKVVGVELKDMHSARGVADDREPAAGTAARERVLAPVLEATKPPATRRFPETRHSPVVHTDAHVAR